MKKKNCFKCNESKPLDEFYKHKQMADGHLNKCKKCTKKDVSLHREINLERVHAYDRERFKNPERKEKIRVYQQNRRRDSPEKYFARAAVGNALRRGKLIRPTCCDSCGVECKPQAHHPDHSKPLEVEWLCFHCHRTGRHGQIVTVQTQIPNKPETNE